MILAGFCERRVKKIKASFGMTSFYFGIYRGGIVLTLWHEVIFLSFYKKAIKQNLIRGG
jgi:hypothetical protein